MSNHPLLRLRCVLTRYFYFFDKKSIMTLKYENVAKIGDRIRSYDFHGNKDRFIEGKVTSTSNERGFSAFVVVVDSDDGSPHGIRVGQTVLVPMEVAFMEYDGRIENLS